MIKTSLHANVFKAPWDSGPLGLFFICAGAKYDDFDDRFDDKIE